MASDNSPSRSLVIADAGAVPASLQPELEEAAGYARAEKAAATRRAYRSDFGLFRTWCETKGVPALPAEPSTVAAFLATEADRGTRPSTISRRLAAIRYAPQLSVCAACCKTVCAAFPACPAHWGTRRLPARLIVQRAICACGSVYPFARGITPGLGGAG